MEMEITINDEVRISDIQREFSKSYPFLKVEFFTVQHNKNQLSSLKNMIPNDRLIGSFRTRQYSGTIGIGDSKTVAELEQEFEKQFGLYAQIFRKSGSLWIETSLTDKWTLALQNSEGHEMSKPIGRSLSFSDTDTD